MALMQQLPEKGKRQNNPDCCLYGNGQRNGSEPQTWSNMRNDQRKIDAARAMDMQEKR